MIAVFFLTGWRALADLQLISALDGSTPPSASANGDSYSPLITPDGRFVLFESTANNLMTNEAGPIPNLTPHKLNLYLRDRTSQTTVLVSANLSGDGANWDSTACGLSTNGQFVLFESDASDLAANDNNNAGDVFMKDVVNNTTILVSVNTNGTSGNGASRSSVMTPDGRYVAFTSDATDLVPNDTNGIPDVFIRDLVAGTTTLVSAGAISAKEGQLQISPKLTDGSDSPAITPDGRYVAFFSTATNFVPGISLAGEVYVRDLIAGTTICASTNAHGLFKAFEGSTNAISYNEAISADGQFVTFEACNWTFLRPSANGLLLRFNTQTSVTQIIYTNANVSVGSPYADKSIDMTPDGNFIAFIANDATTTGNTLVYLRDMNGGTNILVSVDQNNNAPVTVTSDSPTLDPSGRYVAFLCSGANMTTNIVTHLLDPHLYVRDTQMGLTQLIDVDTNGVGVSSIISGFGMSSNALLVAFDNLNANIVPNDHNRDSDVFLRDLAAGSTELISTCEPILPSQMPDGFSELFPTSISTNGRFIAFTSAADNLVANDTNGYADVFVRDLLLQTNILVSVGTNGFAAIGYPPGNQPISTQPSISGDGRYVAFSSWATNVMGNDTNKAEDVFLRDLQAGTNSLVSASIRGGYGNGTSHLPILSADGKYVLYRSSARNLTTNSFTQSTDNLFLRNMLSATNFALTTGSVAAASMTLDGHYVAFIGVAPGNAATNLYVWDSQAGKTIYTNTTAGLSNTAISTDGRWVAYASGTALSAYDLIGKSNDLVSSIGPFDNHAGLQFSADDRYLVFVTKGKVAKADTNGVYDVYLHDFQTGSSGTNILLSKSYDKTNSANAASFSPCISPDERFVAYESYATDIVPGDMNQAANLFLYDMLSGSTLLVSVNLSGTSTGNGFSQMPVFGAGGSNLVFQSYASNLPGPGINGYNAIFSVSLAAPDGGSQSGGGGSGSGDQWDVQFLNPPGPGQNATVIWPAVSGGSYRVQFKNNLTDPVWQNLNGNSTIVGAQGRATDFSPAGQRFYRVVLNN